MVLIARGRTHTDTDTHIATHAYRRQYAWFKNCWNIVWSKLIVSLFAQDKMFATYPSVATRLDASPFCLQWRSTAAFVQDLLENNKTLSHFLL